MEIPVVAKRAESFLTGNQIKPLQEMLDLGEERGKTGWRDISEKVHLEKALQSIARRLAELDGSKKPVLGNDETKQAFCRLMMACAVKVG